MYLRKLPTFIDNYIFNTTWLETASRKTLRCAPSNNLKI